MISEIEETLKQQYLADAEINRCRSLLEIAPEEKRLGILLEFADKFGIEIRPLLKVK